MSIDFRKLDNTALQKYVDHYQLAVRAGLSDDELAVAVSVMLSVPRLSGCVAHWYRINGRVSSGRDHKLCYI